MAKKKAAVKKVEGKKSLKGKKKRAGIRTALPQDSTAYVLLGDYAQSGGTGPFDNLVLTVPATAKDCQGNLQPLSNFDFTVTVDPPGIIPPFTIQGVVTNPAQSSSTVTFTLPYWAEGNIGLLGDELVVTVLTKKKVRRS